MANQNPGVVLILDDDEVDVSFLSELDEVEAQALSSLSKRRRIMEEGAYMAALKGSKSLTWQSQSETQTFASVGGGGGACFKCGKEGHWARECPQTTSSGMGPPRPTSSLSPSPMGPTPEKGCPCGMGNCLLLTANTERNRGRKFFRCPLRQENGGCGFFEWCDDSSGNQFSAQERPWRNGSQEQIYNHPTNQGIAGSTKPWNDHDKGTNFTNSNYGAAQKFETTDNKGYSMRAGSSCFKCGEEGHWARECPAPSSNATASVRGKTSSDTCFKCGGSGHWAKDCSQGQNLKLHNQ